MKIYMTGRQLRQAVHEYILQEKKIILNGHAVGEICMGDVCIDDASMILIGIEPITLSQVEENIGETGLKDKNGNEICDGDSVRVFNV